MNEKGRKEYLDNLTIVGHDLIIKYYLRIDEGRGSRRKQSLCYDDISLVFMVKVWILFWSHWGATEGFVDSGSKIYTLEKLL